jgi:nitrous oxide reductase accessory protein NosL
MNNSILKTASLFIAALLVIGSYTNARAAEREGCVVCGMYLDLYERTRLDICFIDGTTKSTCSLACAAGVINQNRDRIKGVRVADFPTGKLFDADNAYFLEGSDVPGVMTYTSRLAFYSKAQALTFQKKHGGRIITFEQALKDQLKDKE